MSKTQISEFVKDREAMRLFHQERVILDVTERMCEALDCQGMNRVQLAAAMGKSKGHISQLLDGSANMTLRTMSDVFLALGLIAHIKTQPLHPCASTRLTLVHDDEPPIQTWRSRWKQDAVHYSPPPVSTDVSEAEVGELVA